MLCTLKVGILMKKNMARFTALATAAAIACSTFFSPVGTIAYAQSFTSSEGSYNVTGLKVPTLAYDDESITLVWDKPENYSSVADYNIYINGEKKGTARESFRTNADWAATYMDAFYAGNEKKNVDMVNVDIHSYKATGLTPSTEYTFEVRAVDATGKELGTSNVIKQSTTAKEQEFNIVDYGAKTSEGYTSYNDEINAFIEANTKAIQSAIDACTEGGKVVIPEGTFVSGAIYLKSNMTLELQEGAVLWGSPNTDHYDHNYLLYPYSTDTRAWALVNAYSADENQMYENIRITGQGTIYGNGWKYGATNTQYGDGISEPLYQDQTALDPDYTELPQYRLERWMAGKAANAISQGILAKDAYEKAFAELNNSTKAYATRPNLVALRGVDGIYIEGITVKNPAFHTIALLDSKNVVSTDVKYITYDCNNADGIEIGNTQNALIFNNFFDTGDDSINFATGLGNGVNDSEQQASSNIWTFNNFIRNGHGGAIAAGSHTGAGIGNMLVEDNVINLNEMPFRFKSAPVNGGGIYNVTIRDCAVANCKQLFVMTTSYGDANQAFEVEPADKPAEFSNISAYNITADTISKNSFYLEADVSAVYKPWHTHHDLYFQDITCTNITTKTSEVIKGCENVEFNNVSLNWNASKVATPTPWSTIQNSKGISFTGTTTTSAVAEDAMQAPEWPDGVKVSVTSDVVANTGYNTADVTLTWNEAENATKYSIDVLVDGEKVDQLDGITDTTKTITGLSTGVEYTYKVYACDATGNKTLGRTVTTKSAGKKDVTPVVGPTDSALTLDGTGYTWTRATFTKASLTDSRVRGYKAYVNGTLKETFYNYKIKDGTNPDLISQTVRRLTPGTENTIKIVAFTDAGCEFVYEEGKVTTPKNYDHKAPVWNNGSKLTVKTEGNDIVLSWPAATDDTAVNGYRVYVDGKPVLGTDNKTFNQVNGYYTTNKTSYKVSGLDLTKEHTFKVEAGDTWWKAAEGDGPYHWTLSGPTAVYKPVVQKPEESKPTETTKPTATPTPTVTTVAQVKNLKVSAVNTTSVKATWSKADANGYVVSYRNAAGKTVTKTITSASTTSCVLTGLAPNRSVTVTIKAYKTVNKKPVYSKTVSASGKTKALAKVTSVKASSVKNDSFKVSFKKVSEADGYVVTYKNALKKTTTVTLKGNAKTSLTISNLLSNKTYSVAIKPYKVVNGKKVYGSTVTKSIKTAKTVKPAKVTLNKVTKKSKTSAKVSFKSAKNAAGYEVSYSLKKNSGYKKVTVKKASTVTLSKLKSKGTYYVKVRAYTYENKVVKGKVVKQKVYGATSTIKKVSLR